MKKVIIVISIFLITTVFFVIYGQRYKIDRSDLFDFTQMEVEKLNNIDQNILDDNLIEKGKLIVGTSPDFAPYSFFDLELDGINQIQGAESAIAFYVANSLDLELEFRTMEFDNLPTSLSNGDIDIILSGMSYTADRALNYDFTLPYYTDETHVLLTTKDKLNSFSDIASIDQSSVKIAAQGGSIQQKLSTEQLPNASHDTFGKIDQGISALGQGHYDFIAVAEATIPSITATNSNLVQFPNFKFTNTSDVGTFGMLKKGSLLKSEIDKAITVFDKNEYAHWEEEYTKYATELASVEGLNFLEKIISLSARFGSQLLKGTGVTLLLSILTVFFGTILGFFLLFIRKLKFVPLKVIGDVYVSVIRGVPLLLQLFVLTIVLPTSLPVSITIALIINSGAYVSEIIRAGIDGIDKGQFEAGQALGLSKIHIMRKVVLPQALKKISPALGNEFVMLIKETSLASVFYVGDLMTIKNVISSITYLSLEPYIIIGVIYFVITYSTSNVIKHFEAKMEA